MDRTLSTRKYKNRRGSPAAARRARVPKASTSPYAPAASAKRSPRRGASSSEQRSSRTRSRSPSRRPSPAHAHDVTSEDLLYHLPTGIALPTVVELVSAIELYKVDADVTSIALRALYTIVATMPSEEARSISESCLKTILAVMRRHVGDRTIAFPGHALIALCSGQNTLPAVRAKLSANTASVTIYLEWREAEELRREKAARIINRLKSMAVASALNTWVYVIQISVATRTAVKKWQNTFLLPMLSQWVHRATALRIERLRLHYTKGKTDAANLNWKVAIEEYDHALRMLQQQDGLLKMFSGDGEVSAEILLGARQTALGGKIAADITAAEEGTSGYGAIRKILSGSTGLEKPIIGSESHSCRRNQY